MVVFRRLLTGFLALALTHFGVLATAPAHAHEVGSGHGVREMVLAHAHGDLEQGDHSDDDHHAPDMNEADEQPGRNSPGSSHGEHAHVHAYPQFTPADFSDTSPDRIYGREAPWPVTSVSALSHSSFPPLRPPRVLL